MKVEILPRVPGLPSIISIFIYYCFYLLPVRVCRMVDILGQIIP